MAKKNVFLPSIVWSDLLSTTVDVILGRVIVFVVVPLLPIVVPDNSNWFVVLAE